MRLIIGGQAQGKLDYALRTSEYDRRDVFDCENEVDMNRAFEYKIVNHFHILVKKLMEQGVEPEDYLTGRLSAADGQIVIADEIGAGIVPMDRFEREYREKTGRVLCRVVELAEVVERVYCGIPQRLKG